MNHIKGSSLMWSVTATAPSCTRACRMNTDQSFFRTASEWPFQSRRNLRDRHAVATPPTNLTARCTARGTNGTQVRMPQESFPDGFEVHAQADKIRCLAGFSNLTFAGSKLDRGCLSQQQLCVISRSRIVREAGFGRHVQVFEPSKHMLRAKKPSCSKAPK